MRLALTFVCLLWGGFALARLLGREQAPPEGPAQAAAGSLMLSLLLAIALNWSLSWAHVLEPAPLLGGAAALACGLTLAWHPWTVREGFRAWCRGGLRLGRPFGLAPLHVFLIASPLMAWVMFLLFRGALLPVANHDALAYHLPKAVLIAREHGYAFFQANDIRISSSPANYEMLLADWLVLWGTDAGSAWLSLASYLLLVVQAMAMAERWWGRGPRVLATGLLVAGLPVALLQSGGHKNDLLMINFMVGCFFWGARWSRSRTWVDLAMMLACWFAAFGTKASALIFLPALLVPAVLAVRRPGSGPTRSGLATLLGICALGFLLLGGEAYALNLLHTHSIAGYSNAQVLAGGPSNAAPFYGQWGNLWRFPILVLLVPFSSNPAGVWVPWRGEYWFWPHNELYFSHFGVIITALVLALPAFLYVLRRAHFQPNVPEEARTATLTMVACFLTLLPVGFRTVGFFCGYPRYVLFIPILIALWTLIPAVALLERENRAKRPLVLVTLGLLAGVFSWQAAIAAAKDTFSPLDYLEFQMAHPESRAIWVHPYRAGSVVDRLAGQGETIAFDGGITDAWLYPAYGRGLTRQVNLIPDGCDLPTALKGAEWVAIDRAWAIVWDHPALVDMGQAFRYIDKGRPTPQDTRVFQALSRDPGWRLVYHLPAKNQAVFRRVH